MKTIATLLFSMALISSIFGQSDFQSMVDADRGIANAATTKGPKAAYLEFLADDGLIFRPDAVNGKDFWNLQKEPDNKTVLTRTMAFADISSNGNLGYTMGTWEQTSNDPKGPPRQVGQYVTVWSKKPNGKYYAIIDITTKYDEAAAPKNLPILPTNLKKDLNPRRFSAADPSMNFLRRGMQPKGMGGALEDFAAEDVRLILEDSPPIYGKDNAVRSMKQYLSVAFPRKVSLLESSDLAYAWNPCEFANSQEGMERGNCLNILKLRQKKWYVTLAVFARVVYHRKPELKTHPKSKPGE